MAIGVQDIGVYSPAGGVYSPVGGVYSPATAFPQPSPKYFGASPYSSIPGISKTRGKKSTSKKKKGGSKMARGTLYHPGMHGGVPMPGGPQGRRIGEGLASFRKRQKLESMSSPAGLMQMKGDIESRLAGEAFGRKTQFATQMLDKLGIGGTGGDVVTGGQMQPGGTSESERILIQAQEEAADKDINRLQDVLSGAGILSSGTLATGTGQILGQARAGIAGGLAQAAEGRLTRRHQQLLAKRQQLTQLISSILA